MKQGYKNFKKYLNGINEWKKNIKYHLTEYDVILRIYYDDSIKENKNIYHKFRNITKEDYIETIYFNFPRFKSKKHNGHISTFGTLVRFEPIFEKSNFDIILIRDLDIRFEKNTKYENFKNFLKDDDYKIMFYKLAYIDRIPNHLKYIPKNKYNNFFYANGAFKIRFDKELYTKFLDDLCLQDNKELNIILEKTFNNKINRYKSSKENNINYGIDEIFLNHVLMRNTNVKVKIIYFVDEKDYLINKISKIINKPIQNKDLNEILKKYNLPENIVLAIKNYRPEKIYYKVII